MPTYEYVCKSCGHLFEIVQSMRDDPLTECPQCGGELRKVFAPPAISFKGSGFYATDHGKNKPKPAGDKKADADSSSGSGSGSSDTKPAAETKKDPPANTPAQVKDASGS
jgi:putative FmdB family regulatory protein